MLGSPVLINSDVQFSQRMNKAQLYDLYVSLQSVNLSPKSTSAYKAANRAQQSLQGPKLESLNTTIFLPHKIFLPPSSSVMPQQQAFSKPGPCPRFHHC